MDINVHVCTELFEDTGTCPAHGVFSMGNFYREAEENHIRRTIKENKEGANGNRTIIHPHPYVWSHLK